MSLYETHTMKNPQLPFILHETHFTSAHLDYQGNWHENIEVLCFTGGGGPLAAIFLGRKMDKELYVLRPRFAPAPGIFGCCFLVNGDCGGEAVNGVHVGLIHLTDKHSCV